MKALVGETVVAEAELGDIVAMEGNGYFPPDSVVEGVLRNSPTPYTCPWKGVAQYYDLVVGEMVLKDGAWSYPHITQFAAERVGRDFSGYIAFDSRQVRFEE